MKSIGGQQRERVGAFLTCVGISLCLGFAANAYAAGASSDADAPVASAAEPSASEVVPSGTAMREAELGPRPGTLVVAQASDDSGSSATLESTPRLPDNPVVPSTFEKIGAKDLEREAYDAASSLPY